MKVHHWLGKAVSVYAAFDHRKQLTPMARGEVIAVIDCPSIVVRTATGKVEAWPVSLPLNEIRLDPPGCGCTGCLVGESVPEAGGDR